MKYKLCYFSVRSFLDWLKILIVEKNWKGFENFEDNFLETEMKNVPERAKPSWTETS